MRVENSIRAAGSLRTVGSLTMTVTIFVSIIIVLLSIGGNATLGALLCAVFSILGGVTTRYICHVLANISDSVLVISNPEAEELVKKSFENSPVPIVSERTYPRNAIKIIREGQYYVVFVAPQNDGDTGVRRVFDSEANASKYAEEIAED